MASRVGSWFSFFRPVASGARATSEKNPTRGRDGATARAASDRADASAAAVDRADRARTSGHEQRLRVVKVHASHGPVVLVESIDEGSHAVVPQLDHAAVQRGEDPWPLRVERQALDAVGFRLCV